jgi:hypothetical protein
MLRDLEAARSGLGVLSYGLSVTTLEEVVLTLASRGGAPGDAAGDAAAAEAEEARAGGGLRAPLLPGGGEDSSEAEGEAAAVPAGAPERLAGAALYWQQLRALTIKRALCAR